MMMAETKRRKKRAPTYTVNETEVLLEEVNLNKATLFSAFRTTVSNRNKQKIWAKICRKMAAYGSGAPRDWQEVRKKWHDFVSIAKTRNAAFRRERLLTGAGPSTVPELSQMEERALEIIGETSCDGTSGGTDLRRGDAGLSQVKRSPSPALPISQDRPAATSSPTSSTSQGTPPPSRRRLIPCRCSEELIATEKKKLVALHGIEERMKEANDLARQALHLKRAKLDLAIQQHALAEAQYQGSAISVPVYLAPEEDCNAFGDSSTLRGATSESQRVDAPGSSHMSSHNEELRILSVYGKGEGPLAVAALNSLSADHSVAKSLERGERLVCRKEQSVQQQTPDIISIKVEEDFGGGTPAVEDCNDIRDSSTQCGATSESQRADPPGSSHMSSHNGELRILSIDGHGEGPLAVDGLFSASELEAMSTLSADHSVAKSLDCSERLVHCEELTGHWGGCKGQPCVLCGKVFPNNPKMIIHMRTHTDEKPYGCDQCMLRFSLSSRLKMHMRTHTREKPFKCGQCVKRFSLSSRLKLHMRTHTREKPYRCDQCAKSFGQTGTLKLHMRTHTGEKPYKCDQCVKHFRQSTKLKRHMRTHSGEKPGMCLQ